MDVAGRKFLVELGGYASVQRFTAPFIGSHYTGMGSQRKKIFVLGRRLNP